MYDKLEEGKRNLKEDAKSLLRFYGKELPTDFLDVAGKYWSTIGKHQVPIASTVNAFRTHKNIWEKVYKDQGKNFTWKDELASKSAIPNDIFMAAGMVAQTWGTYELGALYINKILETQLPTSGTFPLPVFASFIGILPNLVLYDNAKC